ncbi:MAG: peptidoglycan-binding protein [Devosia sp.]
MAATANDPMDRYEKEMWKRITDAEKERILKSPWPHLEYLRAHVGIEEIRGPKHHPWIVAAGRIAGIDWWNNDEDPWCAVATNGSIVAVGGTGTKSALARSATWSGYGTKLAYPVKGAIGVIPRGNNPTFGHIFFIDHVSSNGMLTVIEGNAKDRVKYGKLHKSQLLPNGIVWPEGIPLTAQARAAAEAYKRGHRRSFSEARLLRLGDSGAEVESLQRSLRTLGIKPTLSGSGYFGPKTDAAVRAFQGSKGLDVDGIVGPKTMSALTVAMKARKAKAQAEKVGAKAAATGATGVAGAVVVVNEAVKEVTTGVKQAAGAAVDAGNAATSSISSLKGMLGWVVANPVILTALLVLVIAGIGFGIWYLTGRKRADETIEIAEVVE